jgi:hypothetical protein
MANIDPSGAASMTYYFDRNSTVRFCEEKFTRLHEVVPPRADAVEKIARDGRGATHVPRSTLFRAMSRYDEMRIGLVVK